MSVPDTKEPICSAVRERVPEVLRSGQVTFVDFHRKEHSQRVCLDLLVPLLDAQDAGRPIGIVSLTIDPNAYLYPFIQRWPTPSETAETLLVRREGNEAVFLNELKFQQDTALTLRIPLERRDNPAVKAVLGEEGSVEGMDYRGVAVVAAVPLCPIPRGFWWPAWMPRKCMRDAGAVVADGPFRGALLFAAGAGVGLVWQDNSPTSTGASESRRDPAGSQREPGHHPEIHRRCGHFHRPGGKISRMNPSPKR